METTALLFAATSQFVGCLEVAQERFPRLHGNDRAAVLPDTIEQCCEQAVSLRWDVLEPPDATEVREQLFRLVEPRVKRQALPIGASGSRLWGPARAYGVMPAVLCLSKFDVIVLR